jgi:hypothetical protein
MIRMFQVYTDSDANAFGIFRELGPAMEWLDLKPSTPWPAQPPDATFGGG